MAKPPSRSADDDVVDRDMKGSGKDDHGRDTEGGTTGDTNKTDSITGRDPGDSNH